MSIFQRLRLKLITIASALALLCLGCSTTTVQGVRTDDIMEALNRFEADCRRCPTTEEGLSALIEDPGAPGWKGPYWQGDFRDRWGSAWRYENDNKGRLHISSPKGKIELTKGPAMY
jgi:hypothetical protein